MSLSMILRSLFEILLVGFTIWALFHEEQLACFEKKLFCGLRRRRLKLMRDGCGNRKKCA